MKVRTVFPGPSRTHPGAYGFGYFGPALPLPDPVRLYAHHRPNAGPLRPGHPVHLFAPDFAATDAVSHQEFFAAVLGALLGRPAAVRYVDRRVGGEFFVRWVTPLGCDPPDLEAE